MAGEEYVCYGVGGHEVGGCEQKTTRASHLFPSVHLHLLFTEVQCPLRSLAVKN